RIKILVHELGVEKFAQEVEDEWQAMRDGALKLDHEGVEDIRARFSYPAYEKRAHLRDELKKAAHDPQFEAWRKNSVFPHKAQGYAIVTISLKPVGGPPGDATAEQIDALADGAGAGAVGCARRSRRPIFLWQNPRRARAESRAAACRQARPAGALEG